MGRDEAVKLGLVNVGVSIHAPAWGATDQTNSHNHLPLVSIHAPAWGATMMCLVIKNVGPFQSTRPHGARLPVVGEI